MGGNRDRKAVTALPLPSNHSPPTTT